jgi:hypothetical protein
LIRLRGHHLLCCLTYRGAGYTPAFVQGFDALAARLSRGEAAVIVEGPDDICAPVTDEPDCHCRDADVSLRDSRALADLSALLGQSLAPGDEIRLDAALTQRLRQAFAAGTLRSACSGCSWTTFCTTIAASGYGACRLRPQHLARAPSSFRPS